MAPVSLLSTTSVSHHHKTKQKKNPSPAKSLWDQFKRFLSCQSTATYGGSNAVDDNNGVIHRSDVDGSSTLSDNPARSDPVKGGMQLRRLSGCYECRAINLQSPSRYRGYGTVMACSECAELFKKLENLELHQKLRHAVSELSPQDSSRNVVEMIFNSSWRNKDNGICMIDRILKVHNNDSTVASFESYRDAVKSRASSAGAAVGSSGRHHRCAADGNELLGFHCTSLSCSIGACGSTALCLAATTAGAPCGVCTVLSHGFAQAQQRQLVNGVRTAASSVRAHECGPPVEPEGRRAMLVCRVIAGRVRRAYETLVEEKGDEYDSVTGGETNMEEVFVVSPRAMLPCFVVIYRMLDH